MPFCQEKVMSKAQNFSNIFIIFSHLSSMYITKKQFPEVYTVKELCFLSVYQRFLFCIRNILLKMGDTVRGLLMRTTFTAYHPFAICKRLYYISLLL